MIGDEHGEWPSSGSVLDEAKMENFHRSKFNLTADTTPSVVNCDGKMRHCYEKEWILFDFYKAE